METNWKVKLPSDISLTRHLKALCKARFSPFTSVYERKLFPLTWPILSPDQSGFLKLDSTFTGLLENTDDLYNGVDSWKAFIDFKKAFGTFDHDILYEKVQIYGAQLWELS